MKKTNDPANNTYSMNNNESRKKKHTHTILPEKKHTRTIIQEKRTQIIHAKKNNNPAEKQQSTKRIIHQTTNNP